VAKRAGGVGPSQTQQSPPGPVKARAARLTKAALPRRAGQEDAGFRPAPCQGAARPGTRITKESPSPAAQGGMGLHTADGARKYLTAGERDAFLRQAELADRVDLAAGVLVIESLKKRRAGVYRAVPVPPALLNALDKVHGIRELQTQRGKGRGQRLWPWSRMTGWRAVHGPGRSSSPGWSDGRRSWAPSLGS